MLATHKVVVDSFRNLWPINKNTSAPDAVLIGRYPEDTYFGGGPWPLCTLGAAELLYDAVAQINRTGTLSIDDESLAFFQDIYPSANVSNYTGTVMEDILSAMTTYADGFVAAVQVRTRNPLPLRFQVGNTQRTKTNTR
jgi:glucoamylase